MAVIDVGGSVREGEELDVQAITDWLNQQGVNVEGPLELTQYSGGASNWTYRLICQCRFNSTSSASRD